MKTISLVEACHILRSALVIRWGISPRAFGVPSLSPLTGEPDHQFLKLAESKQDPMTTCYFQEKDNQEVKVDGPFMSLVSSTGDKEVVALFDYLDGEAIARP